MTHDSGFGQENTGDLSPIIMAGAEIQLGGVDIYCSFSHYLRLGFIFHPFNHQPSLGGVDWILRDPILWATFFCKDRFDECTWRKWGVLKCSNHCKSRFTNSRFNFMWWYIIFYRLPSEKQGVGKRYHQGQGVPVGLKELMRGRWWQNWGPWNQRFSLQVSRIGTIGHWKKDIRCDFVDQLHILQRWFAQRVLVERCWHHG